MKIPNHRPEYSKDYLSLARIVSEDSQLDKPKVAELNKSSKDS